MQNNPNLTEEEQANVAVVRSALRGHFSWLVQCLIASAIGALIAHKFGGPGDFGTGGPTTRTGHLWTGALIALGAFWGWRAVDEGHGKTGLSFYGPLAFVSIVVKMVLCVPVGLFRVSSQLGLRGYDTIVCLNYLRRIRRNNQL